MDRIERSKLKFRELYGDLPPSLQETDPDFYNIMVRFVLGEVYYHGNLDDKTRELISIAVLTSIQALPQLRLHAGAALNIGLSPVEIKEAVYQCAPYAGFPKSVNALGEVNAVFRERNIPLPVEPSKLFSEEERREKGYEVMRHFGGSKGEDPRLTLEKTPGYRKHIQNYISDMDFGDIYARSGLDLQTRELLTFCVICTASGWEKAIKGHVRLNLNIGNDADRLIGAITHCLPYIGFPRVLYSLECIEEGL